MPPTQDMLNQLSDGALKHLEQMAKLREQLEKKGYPQPTGSTSKPKEHPKPSGS